MPILSLSNRNIYYEEYGNGPAVFFIHPPGMGRKTFVKQLSLRKSMRVVLIDLSGHGDSTCSFVPSLQEYMEDLAAVQDKLQEEKVILFGYSAGGVIVQQYALEYPDRVKAVILSGGYPKVESDILKWEHEIGINMVRYTPSMLAHLLGFSHFASKNEKRMMTEHIKKANRMAWRHYYECSLAFDCVEHLSRWSHPTLLLYGALSKQINTHAHFYEQLPDKEIVYIKWANHQLPTRYSNKINPIIENFVKRHRK